MYWLSCLPCHGDKGQGLTDEFRTTYPPEDQYCWARGCHGKMPYEQGFTLPTKIPAVIGPGALAKFSDAAQLHAYVRAAMPFWKPGSLTEEEAWGVTAFILRQNGLWNDMSELNASNASDVKIAGRTFSTNPAGRQSRTGILLGGIGIVLLLLLLFIFILKKTRNTTTI
jgi:cytochrome c